MKPPVNRTPQRFLTHFRYAIEGLLVFLLYGFFRLLPLDWASDMGGFIARSVGPRLSVSRKAKKNLDLVFPEKTDAEKQEIIRGMWDNMGRVFAEYPHLRRIWKNVELIGGEYVSQLRDDGLPGIFVGAHLANWEVQAVMAKQQGLSLMLIYRMPNNYWVEKLLGHARSSGAGGLIPKSGQGAREMFRAMKEGNHIGVLIDQKLNEGIPVPFFGRDAMTAPFAAQLALKFDCPLILSRVERLGGTKFRITLTPLALPRTGDDQADALSIMKTVNGHLEDWIRERPEQWLWLHRRWPS